MALTDRKNHITNVAIIGASGQIGGIFTQALIKAGKHNITAISRLESKSTGPDGVKVIKADYSKQASLADALKGQEAVIVCLKIGAGDELLNRIIRAADEAGVLYILPNWYGPDPEAEQLSKDVFIHDSHTSRLNTLQQCKTTKAILLACSFWFEFSLAGGPDRFGFDIPKRQFISFDDGHTHINTTTWAQCGRAVASLLSLKLVLEAGDNESVATLEQFANKPLYISSFRISQREMFESIKRVTHTNDDGWTVTRESTKQRYEDGKAGVVAGNWPSFQKMFYSRVMLADGDYESTKGLANDSLGLPKEDLDAIVAHAVKMAERKEIPFADESIADQ